jgi:outer membrane usher protein
MFSHAEAAYDYCVVPPAGLAAGKHSTDSAKRPSTMKLLRISIATVLAGALAACANTPADEPKPLAVKAEKFSPQYSSFDTRVQSESVAVDHAFAASLDPDVETLTRLESSYTQDDVRVGDAVSSAGMWGRSVRYGGVQLGNYEARSDVIASRELATNGLAVLPTVADALFASVNATGTSLVDQNLSVQRALRPGGSGAWDLTANDAFGRSVAVDAPLIAPTRLAQEGCSNYSVGVGKVRQDYAITSNEYGPLFANTTLLCSAPLGFTIEGHGEYVADEVAALGVGMARPMGPLGTASLAFASSHAEAGMGWLARVGFEHQSSLFNVMVRSRIQSREFREVGSTAGGDPVMRRNLASVGLNTSAGSSLSLAYAAQTTWSRERSNLIALKQSLSVGRGSVAMSAGHSLEDDFGSSVFFSYKRPFGVSRRPERSAIEEFDVDLLNPTMME